MTLPRTTADVLARHVLFEIESIDRLYLNLYVPELQRVGQVVGFLTRHLGFEIPSTAVIAPRSKAFGEAIKRFAAEQHLPLVDFAKGQRKDDVLHEYLARSDGAEQVLFIGRAQEKMTIFRTERRRNPTTGVAYPWIVRPQRWSTTSTSTPSTPTSARSSSSSAPTSPTPPSCASYGEAFIRCITHPRVLCPAGRRWPIVVVATALVGDCGGRIIGGSSRCFRHRDGPGEEATMNEGCRVRVTGPLAGYVDGFRDELAAQGYTVQVRDRQLRMLAHVSRWMAGQGLSVAELTPDLLEDFLDERRREGYHHALSRRAVMPLMEHLRAVGAAPCPSVADPAGVLDLVVADFRRYLLGERALTPVVAGKYMRLARAFLTATVQAGAPVGELSAAVVTGYVVRECHGRPPGSAKYLVTVLRSVLGFLFLAGHISEPLAFAVPTVAHWRAGSLPRALSPDAVTALTGGCDSATLGGLRDRAIVVLLARLGLRAGEVAALELEDLDWRAGELVVRTCKAASP